MTSASGSGRSLTSQPWPAASPLPHAPVPTGPGASLERSVAGFLRPSAARTRRALGTFQRCGKSQASTTFGLTQRTGPSCTPRLAAFRTSPLPASCTACAQVRFRHCRVCNASSRPQPFVRAGRRGASSQYAHLPGPRGRLAGIVAAGSCSSPPVSIAVRP